MFRKKYPPIHRIDDWQNPWLPAPIRALNCVPKGLAKSFISLKEQDLLNRAKKSTGLSDFGRDDFLMPFRLLLDDLEQYDHFTISGRITAQTIFHQQLCSRLNLQYQFNKNKNISQQQINQPIFIVGLPRTGTTHLHNALSQISSLRYIPLWQTLHPASPAHHKKDTRIQTSNWSMAAARYILPLLERMHEMITDEPHEELTLCALCYRSFFFEGAFQVPNYRAWYANNEHSEGYAYLKKVLQILQTEKAPGQKAENARWILKSPQHLDQLGTILKIFPDAKIILTHRDPAQAVLSMITMMLYTSRQVYKPTRLREEANAWVDRLEQMLHRSQEQIQRIPQDKIHHVNFDDFMKDPLKTINDIQQFANIEIDEISKQKIETYLKSHTRDRHGRIDYQFEDIGLNEAEIRQRFAAYSR